MNCNNPILNRYRKFVLSFIKDEYNRIYLDMRSSAIPIPTEEQKRVFEHESLKILNLHCVLKELNTTFDFLKKCLLQLHQPIPTLSTKKEDIIVKIFKMSCVVYNIQFPIVAPLPQITFAERVIAEEEERFRTQEIAEEEARENERQQQLRIINHRRQLQHEDLTRRLQLQHQQQLQQQRPQIKKPRVRISSKLCLTEECPICYEEITSDNYVYLNCNHEFCKKCVTHMYHNIKKEMTCPLCREKTTEIHTKSPTIAAYTL